MIGIIIQARMGSTRLPNKVLMNLGEKNLIESILFRLKFLKHKSPIVVATSCNPLDTKIVDFCQKVQVPFFRGSETNVLERYYLCAKQFNFSQIIRLTADNPFIDVEELDRLIDLHLKSKSDYSHSFGVLPVGVGAEIFSFAALEKSYKFGKSPHHLEHVNEYILENQHLFNISVLQVELSKQKPEIRLTIDTMEDFQKALKIVNLNGNKYISTEEAIKICLQSV